MSAVWPVVGPLVTEPHRPAGPCPHVPPYECRRCNGVASDEWEQAKADRSAHLARERRMRTSPEFRRAWLESFGPDLRQSMAELADRRYGRMNLDIDHAEEAS